MDKRYAKYILDKTVLDYNNIGDKYSRVREKNWKEMDFLFDRITVGDSVLDFGCGNGRFYGAIRERGAGYQGIDPSEKLISLARENNPKGNFQAYPISIIPFADEYFDKVYSIAVLHHIPSRRFRLDFLREAGRSLKKGGYLILTVWDLKEKLGKGFNLLSWFKGLRMDKGDVLLTWYGSKDTYFHCFNLEELVQLVKEAGFQVEDKGEISVGLKPYHNFYIIAKK